MGSDPIAARECLRLRPSTQSISLRLPVSRIERIRIEANRRDVPYQSPIKTWLAERLETKAP